MMSSVLVKFLLVVFCFLWCCFPGRAQKIKVACDTAGMSLTELGAKMGMSQASISKRVKTGKFTQEELQEMAVFMGCKYESKFIFPDGNEIK